MIYETSKELQSSDLSDPSFIKCLDSVKTLQSTNQVLFTGTPKALQRLVILLNKLDLQGDQGPDQTELFIYKPNNLTFTEIKSILRGIIQQAKKIENPCYCPLEKTVENMRQLKDSGTIQFMGPAESITKLQTILAQVDGKSDVKSALGSNILVYKIKGSSPNELISYLKSIAKQAKQVDNMISPFYKAIESVRYIKKYKYTCFHWSQASSSGNQFADKRF